MGAAMKMFALLVFAALAFGSGGCQTSDYYGVREAVPPGPAFEKALALEATVALEKEFSPGKTTFYFPHGSEAFAIDLEGRLRRLGYAFRTERPSGEAAREVTEIGYKLDGSGSDKALVVFRLVAGEGWQMSRIYQRQKDGTVRPFGPALIRKG